MIILMPRSVILTLMSQKEDTRRGLSCLVAQLRPGMIPMMLTPDSRMMGLFHL